MKSENKNQIGKGSFTNFERIERVPPLKMILYCSMAGIGVLFSILVYMFLLSIHAAPAEASFPTPKFFSVSTVLILMSVFFINQVAELYRQDALKELKSKLVWSMVLAGGFSFTQVIGWNELFQLKIPIIENSAGNLLFLLSALHLLHVAGGLAFTSFLYLKTTRAAADPVRTLIFIRDPFRNIQIEMLRSYWHFLSILWIGLYLVFIFALK